jgi:beta-N-acetylhexosaminidase
VSAAERRRLALGVVACVAAVTGAAVGGRGGEPVRGTALPSSYCQALSEAGLRRGAGQGVVVRMEGAVTPALLRAARSGAIGGVVLFPPPGTDPAGLASEIARLRRAAERGGVPQPIVSIDQEGGIVKRLPELAPGAAPPEIATGGRAGALREGTATGADLRDLGIDVDLAPVLDVPLSSTQFMAPRAFGSDPAEVSDLGVEFALGLQAEGVAATAKHFPGLGRAPLNTDLSPTVVEAPAAELLRDARPFADAARAGVRLMMLSSASYPELGSPGPAVLEPGIVEGLLREELGFAGVTTSDDLLAPALGGGSPAEVAAQAKGAGIDLLLFARSDVGDIAGELARAAGEGGIDRATIVASCERIVALKDELAAGGPLG